jgi:hypothetical protein
MQPHPSAPDSAFADEAVQPVNRPLARRTLLVLWPAFVMAGVLSAMTFAVVDPSSLHWFGGEPIEWRRSTVYSVTFLIYWGVISVSAGVTQWLGDATQDAVSGDARDTVSPSS